MLIGPLGAIVVTENWALAGNCNTRGELRIFLLVKKNRYHCLRSHSLDCHRARVQAGARAASAR